MESKAGLSGFDLTCFSLRAEPRRQFGLIFRTVLTTTKHDIVIERADCTFQQRALAAKRAAAAPISVDCRGFAAVVKKFPLFAPVWPRPTFLLLTGS
jgi:hypothetical protein